MTVPARTLTSGSVVVVNDTMHEVTRVDPVLDPRGGVYEEQSTQVLAYTAGGEVLLLQGDVTVRRKKKNEAT